MKKFSYYFKDDAIWGEREVIKFRWILIAAILLLIAYIFGTGEYARGWVSLSLAVFYILYNTALVQLLKKVGNTKWLQYTSSIVDITVLSLHIYNYSYFFNPIAVTTAASTFLYAILIMLSVLRYDGKLVIFNSLYIIFCYNLIYILRRPYIDPDLINQVASADWDGQFFKTVYFLLMGYFLFSIPKMIDRLVTKQSMAVDERKNMELKLALEQQKRELAIQKLQMEKNLNKQLQEQKLLIEEQKSTLEDLIATKDKLFAIIGHDLRTPFNGQAALSQLLTDEYDQFSKPEILESLKAINQSAHNGLEILSNLINWAQTQTGDSETTRTTLLPIDRMVSETIDMLSSTIDHKEIKVITSIEPGCNASGDENMVKTILRNLLTNAIKYSQKGSEIILKSSSKNNWVQIDVIDKGIGITKEQIRNIFEGKHSASTPGTENEPGTGLGLILCKELAEKNKGDLLVESQPGKGSKFSLILPGIEPGMN
ncbi:MAG: HAMP domain-containing histidine kinase [Marinilabiliaceae bacterium]|nr:HAMP domain-containing histidine kinase [Marinilabiliaceae bacterium]